MDNFWKKWKEFGEDIINNPSLETQKGQPWEDHFKNLFMKKEGDIDSIMPKNNPHINESLNEKFKMEELKNTIKKLKNKKAVGVDKIDNEFLKTAPDNLVSIFFRFDQFKSAKGNYLHQLVPRNNIFNTQRGLKTGP